MNPTFNSIPNQQLASKLMQLGEEAMKYCNEPAFGLMLQAIAGMYAQGVLQSSFKQHEETNRSMMDAVAKIFQNGPPNTENQDNEFPEYIEEN